VAVYVDEVRLYPVEAIKPAARRFGARWCHMTADTLPELHAMARRLGLTPTSFQADARYPHYDLVPSKRTLAIRAGAQEVKALDVVRARLRTEALAAGGCGKCFCKPSQVHTYCRCACHVLPAGQGRQEGAHS
jgi:hypothetical protein